MWKTWEGREAFAKKGRRSSVKGSRDTITIRCSPNPIVPSILLWKHRAEKGFIILW